MKSKPFNNLQVSSNIVDGKIVLQIGVINQIEGEMCSHVYLNEDTADCLARSLQALAQAVRKWDEQAIVVQ